MPDVTSCSSSNRAAPNDPIGYIVLGALPSYDDVDGSVTYSNFSRVMLDDWKYLESFREIALSLPYLSENIIGPQFHLSNTSAIDLYGK